MKIITRITSPFGIIAFALAAAGCNNADYSALGTHAFVTETSSSSSKKVMITENGADVEITAGLSDAVAQEVKLRFVVDPSLLLKFNEVQSASYIPLPEELYEFDPEVTILPGQYTAAPTKIHIEPLTREYFGETYAIPLRLECTNGTVPTTSSTATFVITTEAVTVSSFPMFSGGPSLMAQGFPEVLPEFTVEVRFQISNTSNRNRAVFTNGGSVLLRFEDPQNDTDEHKKHSLVQFQGDGWYLNPLYSFEPDKWQHLALTYDGNAVELYVNGAFAGTKEGYAAPEFNNAYWFGGDEGGGHGTGDSWWAGCKIMCAEARIWSVARTEAQIQNNMTTVSAQSNGLVAYWRFNEGEGKTFYDVTGNGHDIVTEMNFVWVDDIKSTDEATPWP
ncbi:MAG: DUF1735 and LamG domain-containing protein [Rikenellaceae bacterium]|nr:DUF1735 and LamG domain-containing protein [Rikenellaceae bacterium]